MTDPTDSEPYLQILASPEESAPLIHRLRAEDPVHYVAPLGFWFVTRHDDVKQLFHDPENVTKDHRIWERFVPRPEGSLLRWFDDTGLVAVGPESHARIRRLVASAFTPRAARRMEDQVRDVVERFAEPLRSRPGEVLDLLGNLTHPVPTAVLSRVFGVPQGSDCELRFRTFSHAIIRAFFPFAAPDVVQEAEVGFGEVLPLLREMVAERRLEPREDLISDLVNARDRGEQFSDDEIALLLTGITAAGSDTAALGGLLMIDAMLAHPAEMKRIRDDRSLIPRAVNEILRYSFGGPAGVWRFAVRDFSLRGKEIRRGQMLILSFGGANRDPAAYSDPDRFDVDREPRDLLTFGHGPHFCLGSNLARVELGSMFDAVLDIAPPGSRLRGDLRQFEKAGIYRRALNFPVEISDELR